ncbi:MAG TPA: EF-hand domain-containing protein [Ramlibacter sp.]|nr:EF-hand domain-containing protein [Ramlibacter sp.]
MKARTRSLPAADLRRVLLGSVLIIGAALAWRAEAQTMAGPGDSAAALQAADNKLHMRLSAAQVQQAFRAMDRDGDGRLSRSEAAVYPRIERYFDRIDANQDGSVSPEEFDAAIQQAS